MSPLPTSELKSKFLEKGVVKIGSVSVFVGEADFKTVIVKVYEAAPEMPDTVLIGRLSQYARVLSFCRDRSIATGILNGVRTVRMRLSKTKDAIRIAGESVFILYPGQPKTCRKCGDVGHLVQGCKNPWCYNCEAPGHLSSDCTTAPLCGICMKPDHPVSECPFLLYSANVANTEEQFTSYADAAKDRSTTTATVPPLGRNLRLVAKRSLVVLAKAKVLLNLLRQLMGVAKQVRGIGSVLEKSLQPIIQIRVRILHKQAR